MEIKKSEYQQASEDAIIVINPPTMENELLQGFIVERESDGGIIDPRIKEGCLLFPVSVLREHRGNYLPGGDWCVVPYIKNSSDSPDLETESNYYSFQVQLVDD